MWLDVELQNRFIEEKKHLYFENPFHYVALDRARRCLCVLWAEPKSGGKNVFLLPKSYWTKQEGVEIKVIVALKY